MVVEIENTPGRYVARQLNITDKNKRGAIERLSSGYRVNKAADDVSGLTISEAMRGQIRGLNQGGRNAQDGQNLIATADSGMNELDAILHRMKELCVQGANDTNVAEDRESIQMEIDALNNEIDRITSETEFNTIKLLRGSLGTDTDEEDIPEDSENKGDFSFQVGSDTNHTVSLDLPMLDTEVLKTRGINVSDHNLATESLALVDYAIEKVTYERTKMGAMSNRLDHALANASNSSENTQFAESLIRDANVADEMVTVATANIIEQAGISMAAQANNGKETILKMVQ
ncbi:MAG TPA: flagellin [Lachnospiraceae bacterium]|nr:flagellin [Lachnospiraceae bacterium]